MWVHIRDYVGTGQGMNIMGTDQGWRWVQIGEHR